jgi:ATP-dependent protease ClpP protease subunit
MRDMDRYRSTGRIMNVQQGRASWYSIKNLGATDEISIYDEIGYFGVTAQAFIDDLNKLTANRLTLRLSTPGGEVFDGIAIYNALIAHPATVDVHVDALAASIGSVIAMAGDTVTMAATATMMIHDGFGLCVGNAADMQEMAALLDKTSNNIASIYAARTGVDAEQWRAAMRAETWYSADEAVAAKLADSVTPRKGPPVADTTPFVPAAKAGGAPTDEAQQDGKTDPNPFTWDPDIFREAMKGALS